MSKFKIMVMATDSDSETVTAISVWATIRGYNDNEQEGEVKKRIEKAGRKYHKRKQWLHNLADSVKLHNLSGSGTWKTQMNLTQPATHESRNYLTQCDLLICWCEGNFKNNWYWKNDQVTYEEFLYSCDFAIYILYFEQY